MTNCKRESEGFTLVEMTIVFFIIVLLIGGMMMPLSAQRDVRNISETQKQLAEIKEAVLGFAVANGRLPCPASASSNGMEEFDGAAGSGKCKNPWDGFLPARTLGISPTDAQGYAVDAWRNRIRYAVSDTQSNVFTTPDGVKNRWPAELTPDLRVCNSSVGVVGEKCASDEDSADGRKNVLANNAVAVLVSTGGNGADIGRNSADELINQKQASPSGVFISAPPSGNFDDFVVWISPYILYNRLITAGRLP